MIDEILQKRPKKHIRDLNIVPILDMLTTVIFFLLMSTSFIEYTKLTLPPASTVSAPSESKVIPLMPKLRLSKAAAGYQLYFSWAGEKPGQLSANVQDDSLVPETKKIIQEFSKTYPKEKTLQISMERTVRYQNLIALMDGAKEVFPDIVLASYAENDATAEPAAEGGKP